MEERWPGAHRRRRQGSEALAARGEVAGLIPFFDDRFGAAPGVPVVGAQQLRTWPDP